MLELLREMFSYGFLVRALAVGTLIALCAALLGVTLVLKRYSMIGDGLSHVGFGALTVAAAMNLAPLQVALPVVVLAAFLLLRLNETGKIKSDAGIALISTTALAIGVVVASQTWCSLCCFTIGFLPSRLTRISHGRPVPARGR